MGIIRVMVALLKAACRFARSRICHSSQEHAIFVSSVRWGFHLQNAANKIGQGSDRVAVCVADHRSDDFQCLTGLRLLLFILVANPYL